MNGVPPAVGCHILADFHGVDPVVLRDGAALEQLLCRAARDAGAHVLSCHFHSFGAGGGITGVVLLAESHLSIHTWPEHGFAAMDIFMCGATDAKRALAVLSDALAPSRTHVESTVRGAKDTEVQHLDLEGSTIAWTQEGAGPTVIWAHGLLGDTSSLERIGVFDWAPLAASNRLVRYDARGHGRSSGEPNPDAFTFASLADDFLALADLVEPTAPLAAIGCSMGSATILHAVLKRPSRFRRVVLTAPPTAWETRRVRASSYTEAADAIERMGEAAATDLIERFPRPAMFAGVPGFTINVDLRLVPTVLRGAGRSDLPAPEALRQVALPVLILAWQGDPAHPVTTAERLAELIPDAQLHVADSLEQVRGWNQQVVRFLAE